MTYTIRVTDTDGAASRPHGDHPRSLERALRDALAQADTRGIPHDPPVRRVDVIREYDGVTVATIHGHAGRSSARQAQERGFQADRDRQLREYEADNDQADLDAYAHDPRAHPTIRGSRAADRACRWPRR